MSGEISYLYGKPMKHWASILEVMDRNRLEDAEQLSKWIDDNAASLLEEKSKNMNLEAQLLRIRNIVNNK